MAATIWKAPIYTLLRNREKVVILGHSYVKRLETIMPASETIDDVEMIYKFVCQGGLTYEKCISSDMWLKRVQEENPHIVLVVLAGNSVGSNKPRELMKQECKEFYRRLRSYLPNAIIVAAQAEMRFYAEMNVRGAPVGGDYIRDRSFLNKFICKQVKTKDRMMLVGGTNMDKDKYYEKDGIHMNQQGMKIYVACIQNVIKAIHRDIEKRMECETGLLTLEKKINANKE